MENYRTEEEQVEALKRWWKENGRGTIIGVVLALGLGFGWQTWQKNAQISVENASNLYQQMLIALSTEDAQGAIQGRELAEQLKEEHRGTSYALFAALHLARLAVNENQPEQAESELRWVLGMAGEGDDIYQVANLRLARVLASQGNTDQALELLSTGSNEYLASYAIARGDVLLQLGREDEALVAYESAVASLDAGAPVPQTLQQKLQYLTARQAVNDAEAG